MHRGAMGTTGAALAAMLVLGIRGAAAQCCGDCNTDGEVTINEVVTVVNRALEPLPCSDDNICSAESCPAQLAQCQTDLANCQSQGGQHFPASGQITSYGPGSDGDVRAGATLAYTDNGDGTITDNNTGLMWEKKDQSGGIHDMANSYTWGMIEEPYKMNGTMVTELLVTLNTPECFAGYCDWRIPNVKELQSIVDYEVPDPGPAVNAAFNANCVAGCTVQGNGGPMCSCTASSLHWSSTTSRTGPDFAWFVFFGFGHVGPDGSKDDDFSVRAVRGGL
jgi:hypothetical protein